jgi:anti-sigma factor RsiW
MPTCKDMSELATDYLEGALPWHARLKARLHLFLCHACRHYYDQMRQTVRLLAGAPREAPPAEVEQRVLDSVAAAARKQSDKS